MAIREWAAVQTFDALGHAVSVRTNSTEFAVSFERLFGSFARIDEFDPEPEITFTIIVSDDAADPHRFYRGGELIRETHQFWKLMRLLEWQLDMFLVVSESDHLLFHAGSVGLHGAGILIPGSSWAGKSTLTMSLVLHGASYFSDELSPVSIDRGELTAFPKPLASRDPRLFPAVESDFWVGPHGSELENQKDPDNWVPVWFASAEELRSGSLGEPMPISHLIFPDRSNGSSPKLEPMSEAEAMKELLHHSVNFRLVQEKGFRWMARLATEAKCYRLHGNGLETISQLVIDAVSS